MAITTRKAHVLLALVVALCLTAALVDAQRCGARRPCPPRLQCIRGRCRSCSVPPRAPICPPGRRCPPRLECIRGRCRSCRITTASDLYIPTEAQSATDYLALDSDQPARRCGRHGWCPRRFCCRGGFCRRCHHLDDAEGQSVDQDVDGALGVDVALDVVEGALGN